jgi:hypothetical protein
MLNQLGTVESGPPFAEWQLRYREFGVAAALFLIWAGLQFSFRGVRPIGGNPLLGSLSAGMPALTFMLAGAITAQRHRRITPLAIKQFVLGACGTLLMLNSLPAIRNTDSASLAVATVGLVWIWEIVFLGAAFTVSGFMDEHLGSSVAGFLIMAVATGIVLGGNDWHRAWPLAFVALGVDVVLILTFPCCSCTAAPAR